LLTNSLSFQPFDSAQAVSLSNGRFDPRNENLD